MRCQRRLLAVVAATLIAPPATVAQPAFEVLHRFAVAEHAAGPLVQTADGSVYGTTVRGGGALIYRVDPSGGFAAVHAFPRRDLACRFVRLMRGSDAMLYGTASPGCVGAGSALFRMAPSTGAVSVLREFDGSADGFAPNPLMEASDGFIYGTTGSRGDYNGGTIFRLDRATGEVTTVYSFGAPTPAMAPRRPGTALTEARDGLLYGTTDEAVDNGVLAQISAVYRFDPATRAVSVVHVFATPGAGGNLSRLTLGPDGWLYGTTMIGGAGGVGTAYRVDPVTGAFQELHAFEPDVPWEGPYPPRP